MKKAQIEQLRALKKRIGAAWNSHDGAMDPEEVLAYVEELLDILLMGREGAAPTR